MNAKTIMITDAIIDILRIFADSEIGGRYEINYEAISNYINSIKCISDYFECSTKEEIYNRFTEDIYNGLPVWRFLILPAWTSDMVEKSFTAECEAEKERMYKTYKCFTCKYFKQRNTSMGVLMDCNLKQMKWENERKKRDGLRKLRSREDRENFSLKKRCKDYEALE